MTEETILHDSRATRSWLAPSATWSRSFATLRGPRRLPSAYLSKTRTKRGDRPRPLRCFSVPCDGKRPCATMERQARGCVISQGARGGRCCLVPLFQRGNRSDSSRTASEATPLPRRFASVGLPGFPMHSLTRANSVAVRATTPLKSARREAVVVFFTRRPLELVPTSPYDRALYS
jgi:hypothetical protein